MDGVGLLGVDRKRDKILIERDKVLIERDKVLIERDKETYTLSPFLYPLTSGPTSSMTPATSIPRILGGSPNIPISMIFPIINLPSPNPGKVQSTGFNPREVILINASWPVGLGISLS